MPSGSCTTLTSDLEEECLRLCTYCAFSTYARAASSSFGAVRAAISENGIGQTRIELLSGPIRFIDQASTITKSYARGDHVETWKKITRAIFASSAPWSRSI